MENNIKKNIIWNIIGVSIYGLISLFLLIIVKRINGIEQSGLFSYAYSICTLFYFVSMYYNRTYQIANYNDNKTFNQFFSFRLISVPLGFILIFLFCLISKFSFYKTSVILLLMLFRSFDSIADTFYGYIQEKERLYQVGISCTLKYLLGTIIFLIIDLIAKNIILSIIGLVAVDLLVLFLYDINCYKKLSSEKIKIDFRNNKIIFKESLSIFIFTVLITYMANVQKYVMVYFTSDTLQSYFGILVMPATVLSLVGIYIINPFLNQLKKLFRNRDYIKFKKISIRILLILFGIGVAGIVVCYFIGIPFLNIIYNIKIEKYRMCLVLIVLASIFTSSCSIISNYLTIFEKNIFQTVIYIICSISATVISLIFINTFKDVIFGETISYLISYSLCFSLYIMYYLVIINKKIKEKRK